MDSLKARTLLDQLENRSNHRLTAGVPMDANVRKLLGASANANQGGGAGFDDAPLQVLMEADRVAWDDKTKKLVATASEIPIDESVRPKDKSPTFGNSVEQCMEFAMRYFRTERKKAGSANGSFGTDWKTQHNIANEVRHMADGSQKRQGYTAYLNGGEVPPRAGDVLSLETAADSASSSQEFHVCIVSKVYQKAGEWYARVYEANVPLGVNDPDIEKHYEDIPLAVRDGKFTLQRVETSKKGYDTDMDVVGWIHPLPVKALPGAVASANTPGAVRPGFTAFA